MRRFSVNVTISKESLQKSMANLQDNHWNQHLGTLSVQNKFSNIVSLESAESVWSKLMRVGIPQGQLSFLLKAGSDTLPTAINLKRMKIQCDCIQSLQALPEPETNYISHPK